MRPGTRLITLLAASCLLLTAFAHAEVLGPDLIDRLSVDGGSNYLFLYDNGTATPGFTTPSVVTQWSFFNDNGTTHGGRTLEPVILREEGSNWVVTGVGASVTTPASLGGVLTYDFDLVAGSAIVGPGHSFAHHDLDNPGTIEYTPGSPGVQRYISWGASKAVVGTTRPDSSFHTPRDRTYSVQFDTWESFATIGDDLIDRPYNDQSGYMFVRTDGFSTTGLVTEWAIFDNDTPGYAITPLIIEAVGGNYIIRGVGATQTSDGSGEQHFPFDLLDGSAQVGPDFFLGWKDGSATADNGGVADWGNSGSTTDGIHYFGGSHLDKIYAGRDLGSGTFSGRLYSIQATALTPEPTTLTLLALGAIPLLRRRKR